MENKIGERISNLRKQKGLTQLQLAEQLNISDKAVSKWESGKGDPSLELLQLLSRTFNCSIDYIVTGKDTGFTFDEEKFVKDCFDKLREKISFDEYIEFNNLYKYVGMVDKCFCFEMHDKELYEKSFGTDEYDKVFDILIGISMKLNKEYNGYKLKLVEQETNEIKKELSYVDNIFHKAIDIVKCYITAMSYELWVRSVKPIKIEDKTMIVSVPTKTIKDFVKKNYETLILESIQKVDASIERLHILIEDILTDKNLKEALRLAINNKGINASKLQSSLMVGYPTAIDLIMSMEYMGYISKNNGHNVREVLISLADFNKLYGEDI